MSVLACPVIAVVIGEGGSGGAIGIAVANTVLMQENSIYSVIPPEGCASILWRDKAKAAEAAESLKITADSALSLGIIEEIIPEPLGGAHRDTEQAAANIRESLVRHMDRLSAMSEEELISDRLARFRKLGMYSEEK
jgi:acetyl-CoA carboxylase carboxyl transferase subunit alpha